MIQDCKAILIPNLKVSCCLKHIVEMNEICERRMISHKYYKFLVKSLHKFNQTNTFFTTDINLPTSISFMSILSKAMCHFFSLGKFSFSKFLAKIAIKFSEVSLYREHPEIMIRTCAIKNNLSCLYEKEKKYQKSVDTLNQVKKYLISNIDKIIFFNNYIKIYSNLLTDDESAITSTTTTNLNNNLLSENYSEFRNCLIEEMENIKKLKLQSTKGCDENVSVVAFSVYNYALHMENTGNIKEAKDFYKRGYEFSLCMVEEENYLIEKYQEKVEKFSLNHIDDNSINLNDSEDENDLLFQKDEDIFDRKKNNKQILNAKLGKVLKQLENIQVAINNNEIGSKEHQDILEQAEQIKQLIKQANQDNKNDDILDIEETPIKQKKKKQSLRDHVSENTAATTNKKTQIVCREKKEAKPSLSSELEIKANSLDKNIQKFYSSDDNTSIDFHTNLSQINLLEIENQSEDGNKDQIPIFGKDDNANNENSNNRKTPSKMPIVINIDAIPEETKYECVTYYQKVSDVPPTINVHLDQTSEDKYECVTYYTKLVDALTKEVAVAHGLTDNNSYKEYFDSENKVNQEMCKVKVFDFDVNLFYDSLLKPSSKKVQSIKTVRFIKNEKFILSLIPNNEGISLNLYNSKMNNVSSINFDYFKLKFLISKLMLQISLRYLQIFTSIKTLEDFTKLFLVNHISCRYQDGYKFGISQNAIGAFLKKSINIKIKHIMCIFDILIFDSNTARLLVYSAQKEDKIIYIDAFFDYQSFNLLFEKDPQCENNVYVVKSQDYSSDQNIICIGKNVQKLLNNFCFNRFNTFEDLCENKTLNFRIDIKNECKDATLKISEFNEKLFKVIEYTNTSALKNEGIIYGCSLKELLGYETGELYKRTNQYEKTFISQIVLGSVGLNEKTNKLILCDFESEDKYKFYLKNRVSCFDYININGNKFVKMTIYNPIVQQEHTKIFILDCSYSLKNNNSVNSKKNINKFSFSDYDEKVKQLFLKSLQNISKGQDKYIDILEL